jgi:hypothetical protein
MALMPDGFLGRVFGAFGGRISDARRPRQSVPVPADSLSGTLPPEAPEGADWAWRPAGLCTPMSSPGQAGVASGAALGEGMTLFHDCPVGEIVVRQHTQKPSPKVAPQGYSVETFHFGGTYLSFALALPSSAVRSLTQDHLVTVDVRMTVSPPVEVYLRLNLCHGPNTTRITRQAPWAAVEWRVDFDFGAVAFRPDRLTEVWFDLILDRPEMTRCCIEDVVISRRLRAVL